MGLTIHYSLRSEAASPEAARPLVEARRQQALEPPLAKIGDLLEFSGRDCDPDAHEHPGHRWLLTQATVPVWPDDTLLEIAPFRVIAFTADPGEGCEPANVGLCRYPAEIVTGDGRRVETGLPGWSRASFCKTQYASNPDCGGVESFLRRHLSVVGLLDAAAKLGFAVCVTDESGFCERRDAAELAAEVVRWNRGVAAFTGELKDLFGGKFAAEIAKFPNFERLEAEGRRNEDP